MKRKKKARKKERKKETRKLILGSQGPFKPSFLVKGSSKDVTKYRAKYLRAYWKQVKVYKIDQETAVDELSTRVDPELKVEGCSH